MHTLIHSLTQRLIHSRIYPAQAYRREEVVVLENDVPGHYLVGGLGRHLRRYLILSFMIASAVFRRKISSNFLALPYVML